MSGQVAFDISGNIVGDDLETQLEQVERNLKETLKFLQVGQKDILFMRVFAVDFNARTDVPAYQRFFERFGKGTLFATTLTGVQSLAFEELKVEVEVQVAVGKSKAKELRCMRRRDKGLMEG